MLRGLIRGRSNSLQLASEVMVHVAEDIESLSGNSLAYCFLRIPDTGHSVSAGPQMVVALLERVANYMILELIELPPAVGESEHPHSHLVEMAAAENTSVEAAMLQAVHEWHPRELTGMDVSG